MYEVIFTGWYFLVGIGCSEITKHWKAEPHFARKVLCTLFWPIFLPMAALLVGDENEN